MFLWLRSAWDLRDVRGRLVAPGWQLRIRSPDNIPDFVIAVLGFRSVNQQIPNRIINIID